VSVSRFNKRWPLCGVFVIAAVCLPQSGCHSPYYQDRLALFGGLTGAGVGALLGEGGGDALSGAAIGSAVGAASGAVVGGVLDEAEARNRQIIEARIGRPMAGAASHEDIIALAQAGLGDEVIITHVRSHGVAPRPTADDLIRLKNQGVSDNVLQAVQAPPPPPATVVTEVSPPPLVVERHVYGPFRPPVFHGHPRRRPPCHGRDGFHWGLSFQN
jgi:hypothetical protein